MGAIEKKKFQSDTSCTNNFDSERFEPIKNFQSSRKSAFDFANQILFLFIVGFVLFFPAGLLICYFLRSPLETLTNIPFGMLFVHFIIFFLLKFLISILCSLTILRFSYLSMRFLNNINKNKKYGIILSLLNLVKKHTQSETKIRMIRIQGKIIRGQFIYSCIYIYIYICSIVCPVAFVNYFVKFWNFQVPKGENVLLSTRHRCFSPTVMFFFECTFEQFM